MRVGLEGREGVLVVPGGEDDERDLDGGRNGPQHLEASSEVFRVDSRRSESRYFQER